MKGLIFKDFLSMKKQGIIMLLMLACFTIASISSNSISFMLGFLTIFTVTLVFNAFSYDDFYKWDLLARALPVTQKQIVLARYLYALSFILISCVLGLLLCLVQNQLTAENLLILVGGCGLALLMMAILMPLLYKYGGQKGRLLLMLLFFVPFFAIMFIPKEVITVNAASITEESFLIAGVFFLIVAAILFIASYFLSLYVYSRKEV